jgi:dihydroorotate dehydrogenase (NAD+) catalytic subunit
MVHSVSKQVRVPVIGIGGIYTAEDVLEFMMAGASAVQIGTVNFNDPLAGKNVLEDLSALCRREGIVDINEIKGIC